MERKTQIYNDKFDDTVILDRLEDTKVLDKVDYSKKDTVSLDDDEILKELEQLHAQRRPIIENSNFDDDDFFNNGDFYTNKDNEEESSKNKNKNKKKIIFIGIGVLLIIILSLILLLPHREKEVQLIETENEKTILTDTNWATENDTIIEFGIPDEVENYKEYYTNNTNNELLAEYNILYGDEAKLILDYYKKDKDEIGKKIVEHFNINDDGIYFIMNLSVTYNVPSINRENTDYLILYKDNIMYCYDLSTDEFSKLYRDNNKYSMEQEEIEEPEEKKDNKDENSEAILDERFKKAQEDKAKKEEEAKKKEQEKKEQEKKEQENTHILHSLKYKLPDGCSITSDDGTNVEIKTTNGTIKITYLLNSIQNFVESKNGSDPSFEDITINGKNIKRVIYKVDDNYKILYVYNDQYVLESTDDTNLNKLIETIKL